MNIYRVAWTCDTCHNTGTLIVSERQTSLASTVRRSRVQHIKRHRCRDADMIVKQPEFIGVRAKREENQERQP